MKEVETLLENYGRWYDDNEDLLARMVKDGISDQPIYDDLKHEQELLNVFIFDLNKIQGKNAFAVMRGKI